MRCVSYYLLLLLYIIINFIIISSSSSSSSINIYCIPVYGIIAIFYALVVKALFLILDGDVNFKKSLQCMCLLLN